MSINKELAQAAKAAGVCQEWHERILCTETIEGLAALFFNGIDFCLSKGVPSLEYLRNLPRDVRNAVNIYVDEKGLRLGNTGRAAFFGETDAVRLLGSFRSIAPNVPVIVSSGYASEKIRVQFASQPYNAFLAKPYTLDEIQKTLESLKTT